MFRIDNKRKKLVDGKVMKCATHFVPGHCKPCYCTFALIIAKGGNPDWGNMLWCYPSDEDRNLHLEMQQEIEDWWGI